MAVALAIQLGNAIGASQPLESRENGASESPQAQRLFYVSYDNGIDADFAKGNPKGESHLPPEFLPGVQGNAIVVGGEPRDKNLAITKENTFQKHPDEMFITRLPKILIYRKDLYPFG